MILIALATVLAIVLAIVLAMIRIHLHDVVARHAWHVTKGGGGPATEEARLGEDALVTDNEAAAVEHALERLALALSQLHLDLW